MEDFISFLFAPLVMVFSLRDAVDEWVQANWWQVWRSFYVFALWQVNDEAIVNELVRLVW